LPERTECHLPALSLSDRFRILADARSDLFLRQPGIESRLQQPNRGLEIGRVEVAIVSRLLGR
jgi:hypothetical protein